MQRNGTSATANGTSATTNGTTPTTNGATPTANGTTATTNGATPTANGTTATTNGSTRKANKNSNPVIAAGYRISAPIAKQLIAASTAIESVLSDAALQERMAAHGYNSTRMLEGRAIYERALLLQHQQQASSGNKLSATDTRDAAQTQAKAVYMRHVATARVALRNQRGAQATIDLGQRAKNQAGWLLQAKQFYANALADEAITTRLAQFNLTTDQLLAAQALLEAVERGAVAQNQTKDASHKSTQARNAALAALNVWMRDFIAMSRVALAAQPSQPDMLRIVVSTR